MRKRRKPKEKITILWEGQEMSCHAFAKMHGFHGATIRKRILMGWPVERLLEPVQKQSRKKPVVVDTTNLTVLTTKELEAMKGYSDFDLFQLYRRFSDEPDALRRLADFMASDTDTAMRLVLKWKKEGRI